MNVLWIIVIVLVILALLGAPGVGVLRHNFGYAPSGAVVIIVVILLILLLTGRL